MLVIASRCDRKGIIFVHHCYWSSLSTETRDSFIATSKIGPASSRGLPTCSCVPDSVTYYGTHKPHYLSPCVLYIKNLPEIETQKNAHLRCSRRATLGAVRAGKCRPDSRIDEGTSARPKSVRSMLLLNK